MERDPGRLARGDAGSRRRMAAVGGSIQPQNIAKGSLDRVELVGQAEDGRVARQPKPGDPVAPEVELPQWLAEFRGQEGDDAARVGVAASPGNPKKAVAAGGFPGQDVGGSVNVNE